MGFWNNLKAKKALEENPTLITIREGAGFVAPVCEKCAHGDTAHANRTGPCMRCRCRKFAGDGRGRPARFTEFLHPCVCGHFHFCKECNGRDDRAHCTDPACSCTSTRKAA